MALTTCRECKYQVADSAKTCPSCGVKDPGKRWYHFVGGLVFLIVLVTVVMKFMFPSAEANGLTITKAEYTEKWPLTVDEVELACEAPTMIVVKANAITYALNGSARTHAKKYGWEDFEQIWRTDPASEGTGTSWKIPPTGLIAKGMELCKQS